MSKWTTGLALGSALVVATTPAWAEQHRPAAVPTVGLEWLDDAQCAPVETSKAALAVAVPSVRFVGEGGTGTSVQLRFARANEQKISVKIRIERPPGSPYARDLVAEDCDEARLAAHFIIAVALTGHEPETPNQGVGSDAPRDASSTEPSTPRGEPTAEQRERLALLRPERATASRQRRPRDTGPEHPRAFQSWVGLIAAVSSGRSPEPMWGGALQLGFAAKGVGAWAPALQLELGFEAAPLHQDELGAARFDSGTAALGLCPSALGGPRLVVRPCALVRGGWLHAEGIDTFQPASAFRPWLAAGLRLHALVQLAPHVGVPLSFDLTVPAIRDEFRFDSKVISAPAAIGLGGGVGIAVIF